MKTRAILAAIAGALLCAQMPAADNGTGKIIVYYSGLTLTMNPVIDVSIVRPEGRQTVALHAGRYCEFAVAPGPHTLIRSYLGNREPIDVSVNAGETVYVECHVGFAHWDFEVSEDQTHAKLRVSQLKAQN
jgi:hypothetical protein